jgi:hypothetical protein
MKRVVYAPAISFNPAFGLLEIKGIIGECGIEDCVHTFFLNRKITKENNFFRFVIEDGHYPNDQDDYGPNHNGTIVLSVSQATRKVEKTRGFFRSLFEDKAALAKEALLK